MRTLLLLLVLPLVFLCTSLLPGRRFLPILPAAYAPFSIEDPAAATSGRANADYPGVDRVLVGIPEDVAMREAWRAGTLPSWDPKSGLGLPLAARTAAWYPPHAISLILPPDMGAGLEALVTLFLAGLGMWWLLRTLGMSSTASVFGAWAFQSGAFAIVSLHVPARVDAALWLPFAITGVELMVARKRFGGIACAGAIAMSFLAACLPMAILVTAATTGWAVWRSIGTRTVRMIAQSIVWVALGVAAGAIAWLPLLDAQSHSIGLRQGADNTALQSLPISSASTLFVPDMFGAASDPLPASRDPVTWWSTPKSDAVAAQTATTIAWDLFAGIGVLVLAIAGIVERPRVCALPLAMLLVSLGFVQGWPIVSLAYRVPGFDLGSPAIAAGIAWMCWPILAAVGLSALIDRAPRAQRMALGAAVVLVVVSAVLVMTFEPATLAAKLPQTLSARYGEALDRVDVIVPPAQMQAGFARVFAGLEQLTLVALGAFAAVLASKFLVRRAAAAADAVPRAAVVAAAPWFVLAAVEGLLLASAHLAPRHLDGRAVFPRSEAMDAIADAAGDGRVVRFDAKPNGVDDVAQLAPADLLAAYGIRDLAPRSTLVPESLLELMATLDPHSLRSTGLGPLSDPKLLDQHVLDLLRVTCVIAREPIHSPRLHVVWSRPGFYVHARSGAMAEARVAPPDPIIAAAGVVALQLVADPGRDPRASVVIADEDLPPPADRPQSSNGPFVAGEIEVSSKAPDRVDARVTGSSGGWLVFHDQWFPGWKATVNGADAPVVRADHVFRAVAIPPGNSVVRTKYEPDSIRAGATITLAACAVMAGILFFFRERTRADGLGTDNPKERRTDERI